MTYETFPADLPCPMFDTYEQTVELGLVRAEFENGRTRMRRRFDIEYKYARLSWTLTTSQLREFQAWMNAHGMTFFYLDLPTDFSGLGTKYALTRRMSVRLRSNIEYTALDQTHFTVGCIVEFENGYVPPEVVIPSDVWIIAKTPAAPAIDWVIARTPGNPSIDTITAGSPQSPASRSI